MNKKNLLSFIIKLFIVIIIGYIVGFIYNNYRLIRNHNDIGIININYDNISYNGFEEQGDKLVSNSENPYIIYSVENPIFINKLLLDYNIDNNVDWNIDYVYENYYGILEEDNIKGTANKYINIYSEYIKKKVTSIKLTFNSNNKISIENIRLDNNIIYLSSNYIFFLIIFISSFILFYFRKIFKNKIEWIFVIIALSFGIVVLSVHEISIGKSWDDQIHFDNSYGMSTEYYNSAANSFSDNYGNFLTNDFKKFNTPEEIDAFKNYLSKQQFENSNYKSQVIFDYNKITYLPQNIIFFLGNLLKIPFNLQFTLAMAINLIIYVVIVFFAIRKTPCGKYLMLVIGLIPTTLFMASSFSYDPALTAFMLLGISYFLFEYKNKDKINAKNIGIIVISFILASCIKAVYAPIILILLILTLLQLIF